MGKIVEDSERSSRDLARKVRDCRDITTMCILLPCVMHLHRFVAEQDWCLVNHDELTVWCVHTLVRQMQKLFDRVAAREENLVRD